MNKIFVTQYEDIVATQLVGKNLVNADFTLTSISLSPNFEKRYAHKGDALYPAACIKEGESIWDYEIPIGILTSNSLPADEIKYHRASINNDAYLNLWCQDGWKSFGVNVIENEDTVKSLKGMVMPSQSI